MDQSNAGPAEQAAKLAKQTFETKDHPKPMQEAEKNALAVRENMLRLRELRLAKEAEAAQGADAAAAKRKAKRRVPIISGTT
jgi:hypothetical protein